MKLRNRIFSKRYVLLSTVSLVLLGGSIFLNFLLFSQAKKYYIELNETRLDPLGFSYYPTQLQSVTATDRFRVVFFGDSRAASWTAPQLQRYEFINRGIASQTSVQTVQRFSAHVQSLKPQVVVIQVGVNDLKTIALFPDRRDAIVTTCQDNIKRLVEASRNLGAVVIITTIFPAGKVPIQRRPFWSDDIGQAIQAVNAYIATLANERVIVLDTFPMLADSQGIMMQQYSVDELHLNHQGYAKLNQKLVPLLDSIPKSIQD
ncbi:MAG: SGNH/GDSL hydrolase family protein [Pantanalinema sp. GBBB05]|nr:SGNH/GDSL hydrolase family protein [Pantanalinema sp. GBBB05]